MKKGLFLIVLLFALSCQQVPLEESSEPADELNPEAVVPGTENWSDIAEKREKERALNDDQKKIIAESFYETGYKFYLELKYEEAKSNFRKALELVLDHKNAKKYLEEIIALEGGYVAGDVGVEVRSRINEIIAKIEQLTLEVQNHLNIGIRNYEGGEYDRAEEEFNWVIETVKWTPYPVKLSPYQKQAEGYLQKTISKKKERELEIKRLQVQESQRLAEKEDEKRREEFIRNIEMLFEQANTSFKQERYTETIRLCDKILEKNPANQFAVQLKDIAFLAQRAKKKQQNAKAFAEQWKKAFEEYDLKISLGADGITYPSREEWVKIGERGPRLITKATAVSPLDQETELILERRLSFPFSDGATLQQIIDYIKVSLGETWINIITLDIDPNEQLSYGAQAPTPIKNALKDILKTKSWDYMIEKGVVIITTIEKVFKSKLETRTYDVLDLIITIPDFTAPEIGLVLPANQAAPAPAPPKISETELVDLIKKHLGKAYGGFEEATAPGTLAEYQSPSLVVRHLSPVHKEVEQLLEGLRAAMDLVVTVEARFLEVNDNFLEEIGVDAVGLGAQTIPGSLLGPPAVSGGSFTAATSGINGTYPAGAAPTQNTTQLAVRVEQIYNQDGLVQLLGTNPNTFGLPSVPIMSYTRLGTTQVQFLLRAVEKEGRGKILSSPKITVYNGQRGYLYMSTQYAYVRDYDIVMVAPQQVTADPQPAILSVGTILEVRPSISADLRYIMMEVKPQSIDTSFPLRSLVLQYNLGPPTSMFGTIAYEIPDVQFQAAKTNVVIPDGGTILIGGYHTGQDMDYTSGVPILSKIPIIGTLFTEKIKTNQRRVLLMLIKGQITAYKQEEKERF
ncbi:MAG: hypothetical protein HY811_00365 [Planctomycetes bacterium]|nr:hypothetical protein [Planctomycetota bacterium]